MKRDGSQAILRSEQRERCVEAGWRRAFEEQCVLRLCYNSGVGGEGKLNMVRSLKTGSSEHRTELLITIRKAQGNHQRR